MPIDERILALSTISPKSQTTVPKEVREELKLEPGDRILWIKQEGKVYVRKT